MLTAFGVAPAEPTPPSETLDVGTPSSEEYHSQEHGPAARPVWFLVQDPGRPLLTYRDVHDYGAPDRLGQLLTQRVELLGRLQLEDSVALRLQLHALEAHIQETRRGLQGQETVQREALRQRALETGRAGVDLLRAALERDGVALTLDTVDPDLGLITATLWTPEAGAWLEAQPYLRSQVMPNDPLPAPTSMLRYAGSAVHLPEFHKRLTGDAVKVVVLDDGVYDDHEYLNVIGGFDTVDNDVNNGEGWHGTGVAGALNSDCCNQRGALPQAQIIDAKVKQLQPMVPTFSHDYHEGWHRGNLEWGARDFVASWGWTDDAGSTFIVFTRMADWWAYNFDLRTYAAVGNLDGETFSPLEPCIGYNVVCVGGVDDHNTHATEDDTPWEYAVPGPDQLGRLKPDVSAPAASIKTTLGGCSSNPCKAMSKDRHPSGTSFAAPMVAGVGAGIRWLMGDLSGLVTKAVLIESAHQLAPHESDSVEGWHPRAGWGVVQAYQAWRHAMAGDYYRGEDSFADDAPAGSYVELTTNLLYRAGSLLGATLVYDHPMDTDCCNHEKPLPGLELNVSCADQGGAAPSFSLTGAPGDSNVQRIGVYLEKPYYCTWRVYMRSPGNVDFYQPGYDGDTFRARLPFAWSLAVNGYVPVAETCPASSVPAAVEGAPQFDDSCMQDAPGPLAATVGLNLREEVGYAYSDLVDDVPEVRQLVVAAARVVCPQAVPGQEEDCFFHWLDEACPAHTAAQECTLDAPTSLEGLLALIAALPPQLLEEAERTVDSLCPASVAIYQGPEDCLTQWAGWAAQVVVTAVCGNLRQRTDMSDEEHQACMKALRHDLDSLKAWIHCLSESPVRPSCPVPGLEVLEGSREFLVRQLEELSHETPG